MIDYNDYCDECGEEVPHGTTYFSLIASIKKKRAAPLFIRKRD